MGKNTKQTKNQRNAKVKNLPKSQKELTAAESKRVKGGLVVVAKDQPAPPKKDILIGM